MENKNKEIDTRLVEKLNDVIEKLEDYRPSQVSEGDLNDLQDSIRDIRREVDTLKENYHSLDKQTVEFINRLDSLEESIKNYQKNEGMSDDKVRAVVGNFVSVLIGSVLAYVFSQLKQW